MPLMGADDVAGKILDPQLAILPLAERQVRAMNGHQPPRHHHARHLLNQEFVMVKKLPVGRRVAHIGFAVGIDEQITEGRRIDREANGLIRQLPHHIHAIAIDGAE